MALVVGVTGLFGSGKSAVAKIIAGKLSAKIVDADKIAAGVFKREKKTIEKTFGTSDRRKLGNIVFNDKKKLGLLNKIIHPGVLSAIKSEAKNTGSYAVFDVPLLIETGAHKLCDVVIVVKCKKGTRIKRLQKKFTLDEIKQRTKYQTPLREKIRRADFIVDNSGSIKNTEKQVDRIWRFIK